MAGSVVDVRPYYESQSIGANDSGGRSVVRGVLVKVDLDGDGRRVETLVLKFSEHTGLETEWDLQLATTKLDLAVDAELAALANTDPTGATYRAYVGTAKTIPAP